MSVPPADIPEAPEAPDAPGSGVSGAQFSAFFEHAGDFVAIASVDPRDCTALRVRQINAAGARLLGLGESWNEGQAPAIPLLHHMPEWASRSLCEAALPAALAGRPASVEIALRDAQGVEHPLSLLCFSYPQPDGMALALIGRDITVQHSAEQRLVHLATHDPLTGLANRSLLTDRLTQALSRATRLRNDCALLLVDLDRFKQVNDSLGHSVGDALLCLAAKRLAAVVREGDTLARMGGDEFALVLGELSRPEDAVRVADKILQALAQPCYIDGQELHLTASIGISCTPRDAHDAESLLRQADVALYRAKDDGRSGFCCYSPDMNRRVQHLLELETDLRGALARHELELFYQPKADLVSGEISGAEALIRWRHPQRGLIPPGEFIPLAEESGIILSVGTWVLHEACRQMRAWQQAGLPPLTVAVNLSARQFRQADLVAQVTQALAGNTLDAACLELELTESMIIQDVAAAVAVLRQLKTLGVSLAMDDFGTGYSSLGYLKCFPFDTLKIDRSFVQHITTEPDDARIAMAIIAMAHSLRLKVVAEGVEDEGQMRYLRTQSCDQMQGYFFARPMPAEAFAEFVRQNHRLPATEEADAGRTLLLVDDEPEILAALRRHLRRDGYRILTAGSAAQALQLLATHAVQVIVSDQRMPQMSGSVFLGQVRVLYPQTIRLILSGQTDLASLQSAINDGAIFRFIGKPWNDADLRQHIREAFRQHDAANNPH